MKVKLSANLRQEFPNIKIGILKVHNVPNKKHDENLEDAKRKFETHIKKTVKNVSNISIVKKYNQFYEKFGKNYPVQFQVESILKGKKFPTELVAVEAAFMAEIKNMILTAGHDLDKLDGDLHTVLTDGTEEYTKINGKSQKLKSSDIVTADNKGIISSVLYGPDSRTRITEKTKNYLYFFYFPYGGEDSTVKKHCEDILGNIEVFSGKKPKHEIEIFNLPKEMVVTPWEVSGDIDYDKLVKQFGVKRIDKKLMKRIEKHTGELHRFLRRDIFFAHTNFDKILDAYEKGEKIYLYTGRAPSGPVSFGHMVPWIFTKWLQDKFGFNLIFQIPDEEKALFKGISFDEASKWTRENILDIIAIGFDHKKTKIVIDTQHANLMYKTACRVAKKTTASTAKALFGLKDSDNVGKYFYSCMQSVPCFLPTIIEGKRTQCLIPCAIDQDVHFRLTRDVAEKLGYPKPSTILCRFLPGLSSEGKMSSSADMTVSLTDDPKTIKKKIMKYAFSGGKDTLEEHRKHGGNADIDIAYQWLTFFEPDDKKLADIRKKYESGEILSGELKQILVDRLVHLLEGHGKRRKWAEKNFDKFIM